MDEHLHDDLLPGFLLDRYRVEEVVNQSESRVDVRAYDTHTKRMVAIKALHDPDGHEPSDQYRSDREGFGREIDAAARLGFHSHIVAVLDCVSDDDTLFLILEYLAGNNLATVLARESLSARDGLQIAADVADGLCAAHALGIVHCAVEPASIFLTQSRRAKIGNFGKAQIEGDARTTSALAAYLGPPRYLSPEQESFLRPSTDQYSLGLVLFEMLTGTAYKTVGGEDAATLIGQQPESIARLLLRLLAPHPDDRFATMGDAAAIIASLVDDGEMLSGLAPPAMNDDPRPQRPAPPPFGGEPPFIVETEPVIAGWANTDAWTANEAAPSGRVRSAASRTIVAIAGSVLALALLAVAAFTVLPALAHHGSKQPPAARAGIGVVNAGLPAAEGETPGTPTLPEAPVTVALPLLGGLVGVVALYVLNHRHRRTVPVSVPRGDHHARWTASGLPPSKPQAAASSVRKR